MKTIAEIIEHQSCDLKGMFERHQMPDFRQLVEFKRTIQQSLEYYSKTIDMTDNMFAMSLPVNIKILTEIPSKLFNIKFLDEKAHRTKISPSITVKQKDIDTMLKHYNIDIVAESIKLTAKVIASEIMNDIIDNYRTDFKQFVEFNIPDFKNHEVLVISHANWIKEKCSQWSEKNGYYLGIYEDKTIISSHHLTYGDYFIVNEKNRANLKIFNLVVPITIETDSETQIKLLSNYEIDEVVKGE